MTDQTAQAAALDQALEAVFEAARAHLSAVRAAGREAGTDEEVWRSYVTLNNASHAYDALMRDAFGEVTPWDTETLDTRPTAPLLTEPDIVIGEPPTDPHPALVSVRIRRDYRIPSVRGLLTAAGAAAARLPRPTGEEAPGSVLEAVLALVRETDRWAGPDLPVLDPQGGVVTVREAGRPVTAATADAELFAAAPPDPSAADSSPADPSSGDPSPAGGPAPVVRFDEPPDAVDQ